MRVCLCVEEEASRAACASIAERCTILCLFNTGSVGGNMALDTVTMSVCVCVFQQYCTCVCARILLILPYEIKCLCSL